MLDLEWSDVIRRPSVNLILGFRRRGKTALAYYLADTLGDYYGMEKVVFGVPKEASSILPGDFSIAYSLEDIPEHSVSIEDEVYIYAHSRDSLSKKTLNRAFDYFTSMSGKRDQIAFLVSHHGRKTDIQSIFMEADVVIFKLPARSWIEHERAGLRKAVKKAFDELKNLGKEYCYIYDNLSEIEGVMKNPLPRFWSDELSNLLSVPLAEDTTNATDKLYIIYLNDVDLERFGLDVVQFKNYPATEISLVEQANEYRCFHRGREIHLSSLLEKLRSSGIDCVVESDIDIEKILKD